MDFCKNTSCAYLNRGMVSCLESSKQVPWDAVREVLALEGCSDAAKYLYLKLVSADELQSRLLYTWADDSEAGVKVQRVLEEVSILPCVEVTQSTSEGRIFYTLRLSLPVVSSGETSEMTLDGIPLNPELHKDGLFIGPHWPRTEIGETMYRLDRCRRRHGEDQNFEDLRDDQTKDCDLACNLCSYYKHRNEYAPCLDRKKRAGLPLIS